MLKILNSAFENDSKTLVRDFLCLRMYFIIGKSNLLILYDYVFFSILNKMYPFYKIAIFYFFLGLLIINKTFN